MKKKAIKSINLHRLKTIFNKDITDTLKKHKLPLIASFVVVLLACIGIIVSYAFYQVVDETPVIGGSTGEIADLDIRVMAEERDANGNGVGTYALYPYIPEAGYAYNSSKSYCTNGSTITYHPTTFDADITAYGHDVCYLYFDSTANLDLTLNVYAENINSDGVGTGDYTKLETTSLPSIGYTLNSSKSGCENGSTLSYLDEENMFSIEASGKDVCTAYMDAMDVDIQLKVYLQSKAGSATYYEAKEIPSNVFYDLNTSKSACTGTSTLSIKNQKVVIAATSRTSCVAYLDVSSGPILESMSNTVSGQNVTIKLTNSNIGSTPTKYYYSSNNGESYVSSTSSSYTFSNLEPLTEYTFKAYSVDASGKESTIMTTTAETDYVYNGIFAYKSSVQTKEIEVSGYYYLQVWGAQGGSYNESYAAGGKGGYSKGYVYLNKGDTLYIHTGGQGSYGTTTTYNVQTGGGVNGGGNAGYRGGAGGGGTDIRINNDSLYSRVIVAGGGGGAYSYNSTYKAAGGAGGGTSGLDGSYYSSSYSSWAGNGGTQTSGGARASGSSTNYYGDAGTFGVGGDTGYKYYNASYYSNGAGGGGWYGGSAAGNYSSSARTSAAGGGGGSGYVYTSSTASSYPSGCLLNSSYYMSNAATYAGNTSFESTTGGSETGHSDNGYAKVTYAGQTLS